MSNTTDTNLTDDLLDTEPKRILRQRISEILTPELRRECNGLTVLVISREEYEFMISAIKERAERKCTARYINLNPKELTLNIITE